MLYCTDKRNLEGNTIKKIIPRNKRIYYDQEQDLFFNQDNKPVSIKDRIVMPISNPQSLNEFYSLLQAQGALFTNNLEDVEKIENWAEYIETYRRVVLVEQSDLADSAILRYLAEVFASESEVYLTVSHESKPYDLVSIVNGDIPSLSSTSTNLLLSEKIDINEDEYGKIEYQVLVERGKLMNLSRTVDTEEYIETPREVFEFVFRFLESLPKRFPKTFILRIASTKNMYDIMDIMPLELADSVNKIKNKEQSLSGHKLSK